MPLPRLHGRRKIAWHVALQGPFEYLQDSSDILVGDRIALHRHALTEEVGVQSRRRKPLVGDTESFVIIYMRSVLLIAEWNEPILPHRIKRPAFQIEVQVGVIEEPVHHLPRGDAVILLCEIIAPEHSCLGKYPENAVVALHPLKHIPELLFLQKLTWSEELIRFSSHSQCLIQDVADFCHPQHIIL